jgi:hypothetical protein
MMKDIESLDPVMQPGVRKLLQLCARDLIPVIVLETRRTLAVQMAYYARGRAPIQLVKDYYKACGLWAISDKEAAAMNTKTLDSYHIKGLGVDLAPSKDGKVWYNAPKEVWQKIYDFAEKECGLDACYTGDWNAWNWDMGHFQFHHAIGG